MTSDQKSNGKFKAFELYHSLPQVLRHYVDDFLSISALKQLSNLKPYEANRVNIYAAIVKSMRWARVQKFTRYENLALSYFTVNIVWAVIALVNANPISAGSCFIYAIAGYYYFNSKSKTYIYSRFSLRPFLFENLVFAFLGYTIMLPLVGLLSLNQEVEKSGYILMVQGIFLAPIFEEIFFRDVCFVFFRKDFKGDAFAVISTGLLFSLVHLESSNDITGFVVYFFSGLILGSLRARTKNLVFSTFVHASVNATLFYL